MAQRAEAAAPRLAKRGAVVRVSNNPLRTFEVRAVRRDEEHPSIVWVSVADQKTGSARVCVESDLRPVEEEEAWTR